jgi:Post-segregation antitoxin CcdA
MSNPMSSRGKKKNLMLTVDENVVEKAKALGINISDVTEGILRGFVFRPTQSDKETEYQYYEQLFKVMLPLLQEYSASVTIAIQRPDPDATNTPTYVFDLVQDGRIWVEDFDTEVGLRSIPVWALLSPKEILADFVDSLYKAKERRKDRLAELEVAKRIIEAMTEGVKPKPHQKKEGKKV